MKTKKSILPLSLLLLAPALASCGGGQAQEGIHVELSQASNVLEFAKSEILLSANAAGLKEAEGDYSVSFAGIDSSLGEQAFSIAVDGKSIAIKGGDQNGLLYGGLEIADYLKEHRSLKGIAPKRVAPRIGERMLKLNAPLDMRTPSYTDTGENAQAQIKDMWDLSFWKEYFAEAAKNRFNAVNLWSLNPFPSLVKVEGYEDVALSDVWKTKIPFDASYSGNCANMVREEHWAEGSYEVIKKMTIDEKIAHFNAVIDLAHDHGIRFYISTWNLYPFAEHGKHGIDAKLDNLVTKDYFAKSVEALLETYPKLDGMGVCTGENLPMNEIDTGSLSEADFKERWLHDVFGEPLKASLEENPRPFKLIHRMHFTNYESIASIWGDIPCQMDLSAKYSNDHMFVNGVHHFADEVLDSLPDGKKSLLELRNNDFFNLRFGDYDFVHDYVSGMKLEKVSGIVYGSDGYVDGREIFLSRRRLQRHAFFEEAFLLLLAFGQPLLRFFFLQRPLSGLVLLSFQGNRRRGGEYVVRGDAGLFEGHPDHLGGFLL